MITPNPTVNHYSTVSPIGKPILDIFNIEYKSSCIETIQSMQYYHQWNYNLCNALKYLWRLGQKTKRLNSDLVKAIDYLQWASDDELNDLPESVTATQIFQAIEMCKKLRDAETWL